MAQLMTIKQTLRALMEGELDKLVASVDDKEAVKFVYMLHGFAYVHGVNLHEWINRENRVVVMTYGKGRG